MQRSDMRDRKGGFWFWWVLALLAIVGLCVISGVVAFIYLGGERLSAEADEANEDSGAPAPLRTAAKKANAQASDREVSAAESTAEQAQATTASEACLNQALALAKACASADDVMCQMKATAHYNKCEKNVTPAMCEGTPKRVTDTFSWSKSRCAELGFPDSKSTVFGCPGIMGSLARTCIRQRRKGSGSSGILGVETMPGPAPVPGAVAQGKPDKVVGSLSKEVIKRVVRRHISEVKYCYEMALAKNPTLAGRVVVKFVISPTGAVNAATLASSTLNNHQVESCVVGAAKRWVFPAPDGGGIVAVTYPFTLKLSTD